MDESLYVISRTRQCKKKHKVENEKGKSVNVFWLDLWVKAKKWEVVYKDANIYIIKYWEYDPKE